jgi:phosphohistidine phosphatase SixA
MEIIANSSLQRKQFLKLRKKKFLSISFTSVTKLLTFLILLLGHNICSADSGTIKALQKGEKLIFIRHAIAPGGGDPLNFDIKDCSTQRNLNIEGVMQAKKIGRFFKKNNISIDQVLSSEWCRCKDTAVNAFGNYKTFNALNSFFSSKFVKNKNKQMKDLKAYIKKWNSPKNIVFVTHYVVISEVLGVPVNSGSIVISDKNLKVIGVVNIN